ncbi:MAG: L-seryl-tRNA(Sec) selenium transferase [Deltaproteobacteria bacterium]|nr:L-seryl-tRNA(Sec) selenium transferase [Candidatus Anaeroferrophillus wilburensis]MBN2890099.1 L-seryl-tRNA(Sec) selenium transferase [Deltaproteobacteria bacterium]
MKESSKLQSNLARIPAVDDLLRDERMQPLLAVYPRQVVVDQVRRQLQELKERVVRENLSVDEVFTLQVFFDRLAGELTDVMAPRLKRVINATGVVMHTNLGRSPLPAAALAQVGEVASCYSNLEYDLISGRRGIRYDNVEELLCRLTGAEAAMVVNNNAGAVLLVLSALAAGREVVISRGELIEIGGSFRIPEVITQGGALLREVGATNRTHLRDYAQAINERTALILKVHTSNYRISGFTSEVDSRALVALAAEHGLPVVEDLGSGCLIDLSRYGIGGEPTVSQVIKSGIGVVTFSGDKLVGGPQGGIIVGRRDLIDQVKRHPLNRALRIDKLTLAFLEAVLKCYLDEEQAVASLPTLAMLTVPLAELRRRARRLQRCIHRQVVEPQAIVLTLKQGISRAGGGALPMVEIPTWLVALKIEGRTASGLEQFFRRYQPPIITRIVDEQLVFDPRTLMADDYEAIARACGALVNP